MKFAINTKKLPWNAAAKVVKNRQNVDILGEYP